MADELIADKLDDGFVERGGEPPQPVSAPAARPVEPVVSATPAAQADGRRHFEFVEGSSSKFWEAWVIGVRLTTCYGRIGSKGTMTIKDHADEAVGRKAMDKAVAEKLGKGYVEKG